MSLDVAHLMTLKPSKVLKWCTAENDPIINLPKIWNYSVTALKSMVIVQTNIWSNIS